MSLLARKEVRITVGAAPETKISGSIMWVKCFKAGTTTETYTYAPGEKIDVATGWEYSADNPTSTSKTIRMWTKGIDATRNKVLWDNSGRPWTKSIPAGGSDSGRVSDSNRITMPSYSFTLRVELYGEIR